MTVKDLLFALNVKSCKVNVSYVLNYDYLYSEKYNRLWCRIQITKYSVGVKNKIIFKSEIELLKYLADELKQYT